MKRFSQERFERDGYKFTVSAKITATAYGSEKDALGSGAQNVVGHVDNEVLLGSPKMDGSGYGRDGLAYTYRNEGESFDRMIFGSGINRNTKPHEFAHSVGEDRHFGPNSLLRATNYDATQKLTNEDFKNLFGYNVSRHIQQSLNPKIQFGTVVSGFKTTTYIQRKK